MNTLMKIKTFFTDTWLGVFLWILSSFAIIFCLEFYPNFADTFFYAWAPMGLIITILIYAVAAFSFSYIIYLFLHNIFHKE